MTGPVLLVGNFLSHLGSRSFSEDLARQLSARGCVVRMTSSERGKVARLVDMLRTTWRSRSNCSIALVDLYSGTAVIWATLVCLVWRRLLGRPVVLTLHGGNLPAFAARWPRFMCWLLGTADIVIAPSRYLRDQMTVYRNDVRLIPNGLDLDHHTFRRREHVEPNLVWVRAFHRIYNPQLAIRVLADLSPGHPQARLTMIGPDKGDGSLAATVALAERLGVRHRVVFVGRVAKPDVPEWLDRADVLLNTPTIDNTPLSVIEAMASGLCVVSTNVGGLPYLLDDGRDALLVPPDDAAAMAAQVRRLLATPALAAGLSSAGREKAASFDWSIVIPQWLGLITTAVPRT